MYPKALERTKSSSFCFNGKLPVLPEDMAPRSNYPHCQELFLKDPSHILTSSGYESFSAHSSVQQTHSPICSTPGI
ncbi:hypothetical protein ILYODFUR_019021 [Ilyodon furcidens]|uniref:Uncharacterized protein n=1 Tax=Ilyodon furcidens TaxID=33524 RepID=A0ABV0TYP6_9TELE